MKDLIIKTLSLILGKQNLIKNEINIRVSKCKKSEVACHGATTEQQVELLK